jgi:hypothetical protein
MNASYDATSFLRKLVSILEHLSLSLNKDFELDVCDSSRLPMWFLCPILLHQVSISLNLSSSRRAALTRATG